MCTWKNIYLPHPYYYWFEVSKTGFWTVRSKNCTWLLKLHAFSAMLIGLLWWCSSGYGESLGQKEMVLGSKPPGCVNKCLNCRPCIATLVIPSHQKKGTFVAWSRNEDDSYYLLTWRCRCGNKFYQPWSQISRLTIDLFVENCHQIKDQKKAHIKAPDLVSLICVVCGVISLDLSDLYELWRALSLHLFYWYVISEFRLFFFFFLVVAF